MLRILVIVLVLFQSSLIAQIQDSLDTPLQKKVIYDLDSDKEIIRFETQEINEFKENDDFNYIEKQEPDNIWTRFKQWLGQIWDKFLKWLFDVDEVSGFWAVLFQILPYLVVIGVIFLLVRLFMKVNPGEMLFEKQEAPQITITEDEDIIQNQDIQQLITQALQSKNYRLAIRYHYLFVLKKLSDQEYISWESQKTNTDYIKELSGNTLKHQFSVVTRLYDFIWYGNFDVDEKAFHSAKEKFITITKTIQS